MENIDVDLYEGDVNFQSDDERVTKALVFYLRAKGIAEVITTLTYGLLLAGVAVGGLAMINTVIGLLKGI